MPDLVRACNDPETQRWLFMLPTPYGERDAREFLAQAAAGWEHEREAFYAIADAASDRLLGGVALRAEESWAGVAELGYHVAPWARRRGVATAAARLVTQWSLDVLGMARVQILADTRNAGLVRRGDAPGFHARRSAPLRPRPRGRPRRPRRLLAARRRAAPLVGGRRRKSGRLRARSVARLLAKRAPPLPGAPSAVCIDRACHQGRSQTPLVSVGGLAAPPHRGRRRAAESVVTRAPEADRPLAPRSLPTITTARSRRR